jgi:hypothetical protein
LLQAGSEKTMIESTTAIDDIFFITGLFLVSINEANVVCDRANGVTQQSIIVT